MPRPATGINDPQANGSACRARPAPRPAPQSTASPSGAWPLGHFPDDLRVDDLRPAPPRGPRTVQASQEAAALRLRGRFLLLARVRVPGPGPCPGGRDRRPCCGPSAVLAPIPAAASAPLGVEPRPQRRGLRRPRRQPDRCRPAAVGPAAGDRCPQRAEAPPPGECSRCRTRLDSCIASLGLVVVAGLGREDRQVRDRVPATAAALPRRGSSTAPASGGRPGWKTADSTRRCRPLWERARPGSRATCWTRAPG